MISIKIATRKYEGEEYTYYLNVPSYDGENGVLNVEINPHITVDSPANCFGYVDTFIYNSRKKSGYFQDKCHPNWIKRKIIETCGRLEEKALDKYYYGAYLENGKYNSTLLEGVEYDGTLFRGFN